MDAMLIIPRVLEERDPILALFLKCERISDQGSPGQNGMDKRGTYPVILTSFSEMHKATAERQSSKSSLL